MATTSTSLLQTALQNLHVSQQIHQLQSSHTSHPPSSSGGNGSSSSRDGSSGSSGEEEDEESLVRVGQDTRPVTPSPGEKGLALGQKVPSGLGGRGKDPLRTFPTHLAVRILLQLDIRSLGRCERVCQRWRKSSTLNYVWYLQNRALVLPELFIPGSSATGKIRRTGSDTPEFFDPYDKTPRLSSLPQPRLPTSAVPQWSKAESKRGWKTTFRSSLKRSDPAAEPAHEPLRVDISSLQSSGASTPGRHAHAGMGAGSAARWASEGDGESYATRSERKLAAREEYKALGGRKSRAKRKMGGELGSKDKGGAADDGRFDAPW